ncbi:hypothetical protein FBU30_001438 [Linnemannia zychae]|nr:hypothetical protein FBU30_001438 [Linnemannia zychae]
MKFPFLKKKSSSNKKQQPIVITPHPIQLPIVPSPFTIPEILERIFSYVDEFTMRRTVIFVCRLWFQMNQHLILRELVWDTHVPVNDLEKTLSKLADSSRLMWFCDWGMPENASWDKLIRALLHSQSPPSLPHAPAMQGQYRKCLLRELELRAIKFKVDSLFTTIPFPPTLTSFKFSIQHSNCDFYLGLFLETCPLLEEFHGEVKEGCLSLIGSLVPSDVGESNQRRFLPLRTLILRNAIFNQPSLKALLLVTPRIQELKLIGIRSRGILIEQGNMNNNNYSRTDLVQHIQSLPIMLRSFHYSLFDQNNDEPGIDEMLTTLSPLETGRSLWTFGLTPSMMRKLDEGANFVTTLELYWRQSDDCNSSSWLLHRFMCYSPHLLHVKTSNVAFQFEHMDLHRRAPITWSSDSRVIEAGVWACKNLRTLHLELHGHGHSQLMEPITSRIVFSYISTVCPRLQELQLVVPAVCMNQHGPFFNQLNMRLEGGFVLLTRLKDLERLRINFTDPVDNNIAHINWMIPSGRTDEFRTKRQGIMKNWSTIREEQLKLKEPSEITRLSLMDKDVIRWRDLDTTAKRELWRLGLLLEVRKVVEQLDKDNIECWPLLYKVSLSGGFGQGPETCSAFCSYTPKNLLLTVTAIPTYHRHLYYCYYTLQTLTQDMQQQQQHMKQLQQHDLTLDSYTQPQSTTTDVYSTISNVVNIDAIELEKENIQPLRQGRSAQVLTRLFTTQHDDRAQQQAAMHGRFQEELAHLDELEDPLDVYSRYVKWMVENYPQSAGQGYDSQLTPILERALADFKDEQRYKNDTRFVKLLIIYSEKITNPVELFNFMEANGIGSEISMYYEEFADFLESREEFDRAREVFVTGIGRRARPLGRLKKQYEDFERRAQNFIEEQESESIQSARSGSALQEPSHNQQSSTSSMSGESQRRVLGIKVSGTRSIHPNTSTQGHIPIGQERSDSSMINSGIRSTVSSGQARSMAKLQIYSDQTSQSLGPSKSKAVPKQPTLQNSTSWKEFGTEQVRRKENMQEATSWKGATLTSKDTIPRRLHPKLEIYRDPETTSPSKESKPLPTSASSIENSTNGPILSSSIPSTMSALNNARLNVLRESTSSLVQPKSTRSIDEIKYPLTFNVNGKPERLMIDLKDIYFGGDEFCVEELRAKCTKYFWKPTHNPDPDTNNNMLSSLLHSSPSPLMHSPAKHRHDDPGSNSGFEKRSQKRVQTEQDRDCSLTLFKTHAPLLPVKELLPQNLGDEEEHFFRSKRRLTSSPTLNTKYASEEMNKIFSDRSRSRKSIDSEWSAEDTRDVGQNELDNFTMAYSIPALPLFSREHLDRDVTSEFEDDDDQDDRTGSFIKKLENGYASTITQDIAELKRRYAEESAISNNSHSSQGRQLSLHDLKGKRISSTFAPFETTESDITITIRKWAQQKEEQHQLRQQELEHQQHRQNMKNDDNNQGTNAFRYMRSSFGRVSTGKSSWDQRRNGKDSSNYNAIERSSQDDDESPLSIFKDSARGVSGGKSVPMLDDETPPVHLHKEDLV